LDTLDGTITVLEENNGEDGSDDGHNQLYIGGLREAEGVQEVSLQEETELVAPADLANICIRIVDRLNALLKCLKVVLKF